MTIQGGLMKLEDIARKVLEPRIKVPLDDCLANTTPSRCLAMYVHSAYEAVIEAIELDRKTRRPKMNFIWKGKRYVAMEYHEYDCPYWRIGKSHGPCCCRKIQKERKR